MQHHVRLAASLAFALAVLGCTHPSSALSPSTPYVRDNVGTKLDACLHDPATKTTIDISKCYDTARTAYASALDAAFAKALAHLDATSAERLRTSEKSWEAYRKDETHAEQGPWVTGRGTIVGSQIAQVDVAALKQRIIEIDLLWPGLAVGDQPLEIGMTR